jgi:hypothetical protein
VVARTARLGRFLGGARYASGFALTLPGFRAAPVRLDADGHAFGWRAITSTSNRSSAIRVRFAVRVRAENGSTSRW